MEELNALLKELYNAASKSDWNRVDRELIPKLCEGPYHEDVVMWSCLYLNDSNPNVRDLAATVLQKYNIPKELWDKLSEDIIVEKMIKDDHNPVRYRLAIALAEKGFKPTYKDAIVKLLSTAVSDKYVGDKVKDEAKSALEKINTPDNKD